MAPGKRKALLLVVGVLVLYGAVAGLLLRALPGPHTAADLMVIGSVATFVVLLALFLLLILTWFRRPDTFFKRRRR